MEYLSRLSGLVTTPAKAAAGITSSPRLRKKPSLHPVGSVDVFHADWLAVQAELHNPDERALFFGVARSDVPRRLQRIIDALVFESNRSNHGHTGPCMEYLLKYDILTELVHLSVDDRPKGIRGETIRALKDLIILLDEKFLSRQAANKPISQLIQLYLDEDATRFQLDDDSFDASASNEPATVTQNTDYEEDLVDLMCHIASRVRNTPELLQIFFTDEPIEVAHSSEDARSLKDGSIIISGELFNDLTPKHILHHSSCPVNEVLESDALHQRSPSPAGSVDSTATIQPSTAYASRKQSKRRLRFPLFSYLLKFVHREGRIGELARAGLLFLISLEGVQPANKGSSQGAKARKAPKRVSFGTEDIRRSLAVFIAHSDFADVLGAGLGAAYGLLPSRIRPVPRYDPIRIDTNSLPKGERATITLASSSASEASNIASEALASATQSDDAELQVQLRLLVDLLEFCQDLLDSLWLASKHLTQDASAALSSSSDYMDEKVSQEVPPSPTTTPDLDPMIRKLARAIAIAIRDTFIRNVVYPSLMESSDFDGSSAAVLNYLDIMVIVLRSGHVLTNVALDFLLPGNMSGFTAEGDGYDIDVPVDQADRYSVKDLILDSLETTKRPATRVAALRLARSLVVCHGFRACDGLLQLVPRKAIIIAPVFDDWSPHSPNLEPEDTSACSKVDLHFREIDHLSSLLSSFGSTRSSDTVQASLSNYLVDAEQALRHDSTFSVALDFGGDQIPLLQNDPFVQQLFAELAGLFSQPVEVNLAASGILSALAASPVRSLRGWLTHSTKDQSEEPGLLQLLSGLVHQVAAYRDSVPDFDRYLAERRRSLILTEDLSAALTMVDPSIEEDKSGTSDVLAPCITLPRMAPHNGSVSRMQTNQSIRAAQRDYGVIEDRRSSLPAVSPPPSSLPRPENEPAANRGSALARLFGGRPSRTPSHLGEASALTDGAAADAASGAGDRKVSASTINPYAEHFRETAAVVVKTQLASGAEEWRPAPTSDRKKDVGKASLSSVLDNTILLEELIKELLAIVMVRRCWGIDAVSFV
ncbi:uncharacterized protein MEPE_02041 [Melanopsichium pennsylvanicum]|uniref:FHF complex subunit HOOK-interacting protein C-terminal domain-containing protein n=2 Tax=Melanopsichium pennsylvanicum TaxID=63383 RepID=A0AAJ4XIN9_9BASI|nr:uncharacterized conserved protein [Melanopsichium pennsylvanicum 4]SNX83334.1 uncharacterized protein MEPE_02041 [Melanopsichium pennsylvanicum]